MANLATNVSRQPEQRPTTSASGALIRELEARRMAGEEPVPPSVPAAIPDTIRVSVAAWLVDPASGRASILRRALREHRVELVHEGSGYRRPRITRASIEKFLGRPVTFAALADAQAADYRYWKSRRQRDADRAAIRRTEQLLAGGQGSKPNVDPK